MYWFNQTVSRLKDSFHSADYLLDPVQFDEFRLGLIMGLVTSNDTKVSLADSGIVELCSASYKLYF